MEMRLDPQTDWECPWCGLCDKWVTDGLEHLKSVKHEENISARGIEYGPRLQGIIIDALACWHEYKGPSPCAALAAETVSCQGMYPGGEKLSGVTLTIDVVPRDATHTHVSNIVLKEQLAARLQQRCANKNCTYMVHSDPSLGYFCCKKCCESSCTAAPPAHGKRCERRLPEDPLPRLCLPWASCTTDAVVSACTVLPGRSTSGDRLLEWQVAAFQAGAVALADFHDPEEPTSLSIRRGDRLRAAVPWAADDSWMYVWLAECGGRSPSEGWVRRNVLWPARFV